MDLSPQFLRASLQRVELEGWDGDAGRQLLDHVRRAVVVPAVRRSGLRGPAADQAEASGWEAAWDALRRPTARTAENPGGMVWVAVRRAIAAEADSARMLGGGPVGSTPDAPAGEGAAPGARTPPAGRRETHLTLLTPPGRGAGCLSLDELMDGGWQPADEVPGSGSGPGRAVAAVLDGLVVAGWNRADAADAIAIMADHAVRGRSGSPTTRWRWVSLRLGVPEWRARRLAALLLGGDRWPGVLELAVRHGAGVVGEPAVQGALRSTTVRWSAGPGAWLEGCAVPSPERGIA